MDQFDGGCLGKKQKKNPKMMSISTQTEDEQYVKAYMPIDQHCLDYKMTHKTRGLLLIFNHETFDPSTGQPPRPGTDADVKKITKCFNTLGFEIPEIPKDLTLIDIQNQIRKFANQDHSNKDCLAIFMLTHGGKDKLYAKDDYYDPSVEIWGKFTSNYCPSLAGKPKLVFVQACQGMKLDRGIQLAKHDGRDQFDGNMHSYEMPVWADFLIFFATMEGHYAVRNSLTGSKWVTILCEELEAHYVLKDLLTILTYVNRRLAVEFLSEFKTKQASYFRSSLTRSLVFGEKESL